MNASKTLIRQTRFVGGRLRRRRSGQCQYICIIICFGQRVARALRWLRTRGCCGGCLPLHASLLCVRPDGIVMALVDKRGRLSQTHRSRVPSDAGHTPKRSRKSTMELCACSQVRARRRDFGGDGGTGVEDIEILTLSDAFGFQIHPLRSPTRIFFCMAWCESIGPPNK